MPSRPRIKDDQLEAIISSIVISLKDLNGPRRSSETSGTENSEEIDHCIDDLSNTFASLEIDTLDQRLAPVKESLHNLDVGKVLDPKRDKLTNGSSFEQSSGANRLSGHIRPIHDMVYPPTPIQFKNDGDCHYVRYLHVTENNCFSIGIFVFPPRAKIPLHDHPGMCVLSRVLYGELHLQSYDILEDEESANANGRDKSRIFGHHNKTGKDYTSWISNLLPSFSHPGRMVPHGSKRARKSPPRIIRAPDVTSLYPLKGNMHEFRAGENGAAVLDVLMPPYEDDERECTFYVEERFDTSHNSHTHHVTEDDSETDFCWLVPIDQPSNFHCVGGQYGSYNDE